MKPLGFIGDAYGNADIVLSVGSHQIRFSRPDFYRFAVLLEEAQSVLHARWSEAAHPVPEAKSEAEELLFSELKGFGRVVENAAPYCVRIEVHKLHLFVSLPAFSAFVDLVRRCAADVEAAAEPRCASREGPPAN